MNPIDYVRKLYQSTPKLVLITIQLSTLDFEKLAHYSRQRILTNQQLVALARTQGQALLINDQLDLYRRRLQDEHALQPFRWTSKEQALWPIINCLIHQVYICYYPYFDLARLEEDINDHAEINPYVRSLHSTHYNTNYLPQTNLYYAIKQSITDHQKVTPDDLIAVCHLLIDILKHSLTS